jgi:hypothetical protein
MERGASSKVLVTCRQCGGPFGTYRVEIVRGDDGAAFVMRFSDGPKRGPRTGTGVYHYRDPGRPSYGYRQRFRVVDRRCHRNETVLGADFPDPVDGILTL